MKTTEIVFRNENGVPVTTSVIVAEYFEKNHKHVMEAIQDIIATAEKSAIVELQELKEYFELSSYETMMPGNTGAVRKYPMYIMNEEGFTHLAMGFTGEKAKVFKQRYIKAFKAMRNVIQNQMGGTAQLMQSQQMITQNLLLLSQQMETTTRTTAMILERLERLEQNTASGVGKAETPKPERKVPWITSKRNLIRPFVNVKEAVLELDSRGVYVSPSALYRYLRSMNYISSDNRIYNRPTPESIRTGLMSFANSGSKILSTNPTTRRRYYTPLLSRKFLELLAKDLDEIAKTNPTAYQLDFKFGKEVQR